MDENKVVERDVRELQVEAERRHLEALIAFDKLPEVERIKRALGSYLDELPSKAERYRQLNRRGLSTYSRGTFVQKWRDGYTWAKSNVGFYRIAEVLSMLNMPPDTLGAERRNIEALKAAIPTPRVVMTIPRP
jgi:hypothetical protein